MTAVSNSKNVWNNVPGLVDRLKELYKRGDSCSQIATALSAEFGFRPAMTRNSVIGKTNRLNLPKRGPSIHEITIKTGSRKAFSCHRIAKPKPPRQPKFKPAKLREVPVTVLSPHPVAIMDLKHSHCRAIIQGERSEALYCGNPKDAIGSYCPGHRAQFTSHRPANKEERSIAHSLFVAKRAA